MTRQTPSDLYAWHRYYAFDDQEFIESATKIKQRIAEQYGTDAQLGTGAVLIPLPGKEEIEAKETFDLTYPKGPARELDDEQICRSIQELAIEFERNLSDVAFYINGFYVKKPPQTNSRVAVGFDGRGVFVRVAPTASYDDFINSWESIKIFQGLAWDNYKATKNKLPLEIDLLYAIFRARSKNLKFSEIFQLYQEGKLPQYKGSTGQFTSEHSLAAYYRKYRPNT